MLVWLPLDPPPHAAVAISRIVPATNRWRLPQIRPEGTKMKAAMPTPSKYQPVKEATAWKSIS